MSLKFSHDLESLLRRVLHQSLTLKDLIEQTSERGFSLLIVLLVFPFLLPMPPGLSSILGSASFLLSIQMALGKHKPWLPRQLTKLKFPHKLTRQILHKLKRVTRFLEKIVRPRLSAISTNKYIWRINGLCIAWLTILLMLPIPFTNPLPATGILLLAIATLESDGLIMGIAYIFSIFVTVLFVFIGYALWQAPNLLPTWIGNY